MAFAVDDAALPGVLAAIARLATALAGRQPAVAGRGVPAATTATSWLW